MIRELTALLRAPGTRLDRLAGWLVLVGLVAAISGCAGLAGPVAPPAAGIGVTSAGEPGTPPAPGNQAGAQDAAGVLEERHGIAITLLGVTAGGGLLDLRYKVLDPDKATAWLENQALAPKLVDETNGAEVMAPAGSGDAAQVEAGKVYYLLLGNPGGSFRRGNRVAVVIGDLRVGPITAQ